MTVSWFEIVLTAPPAAVDISDQEWRATSPDFVEAQDKLIDALRDETTRREHGLVGADVVDFRRTDRGIEVACLVDGDEGP